MLQCSRIFLAMGLCLGTLAACVTKDQVANEQPSTGGNQPTMHGFIRAGDSWMYSGDVIVTNIHGFFCDGFRCAHGRGKVGGELAFRYAGTFRYGDIVGEGKISIYDLDDDSAVVYSGPILSSSIPGGPAPLCGEPDDKVLFSAIGRDTGSKRALPTRQRVWRRG